MPPSLNFPQLDFVKPSSGFHPVTWERVKITTFIDLSLEYSHKFNFYGKIKCSSLVDLISDILVIGIVINPILMVELNPR